MQIDLEKLCEQAGVALYDEELVSENGRKIYRIYIAKKGGVSLDDCQNLSELLSPILDAYPPCAGEYSFEVSSPGLERKLTKARHFSLSLGEKIELNLNDKTKFIGELLDCVDEKSIVLLLEDGTKKEVDLKEIKKARTYVVF
ncbi:ribosome maturation factor [Campylobacter troglodytis]|nr:ribosome maturation factor [Campylobacter troglodytis]